MTSHNCVTLAAIDYANSYPDDYVPGAEVTDNAMKNVIWTVPVGVHCSSKLYSTCRYTTINCMFYNHSSTS